MVGFIQPRFHNFKTILSVSNEKDIVDEIIFRTDNPRNRLMLELMARGGMRIGEVLKLRAMDVENCKLFLINPKSGRQHEVVFM